MSWSRGLRADAGFARKVDIRPIRIEDLSTVRYLHTTSFKAAAATHYDDGDVQAFADFVRTTAYADDLLRAEVFAAWIETELVGTAAWSPAEDHSPAARVRAVFVHPLFMNAGIGRRLVETVEGEAREAGCVAYFARAPLNTVEFFERLGYAVTAHGACALAPGRYIPFSLVSKPAG